MAKFCKYCGQPLADTAAFCGGCGKPVEQTPAQPPVTPAQPVTQVPAQPVAPVQPAAQVPVQPAFVPAQPVQKKKVKPALIIGIAAAVVAVIVLIVLLVGGGSSPEKAFKTMWAVAYEGDTGSVRELMPESCWTYVAQRYGANEQMLSYYISQEFSENAVQAATMNIDFEILNTVDANEVQLAELRAEIAEEFECISPLSVTEACALNVQLSLNGQIDVESMYAVKIDGDWYLLDGIEMLMEAAEDMT